MPQVVIYTTNWCPYCRAAKSLFLAKKIAFTEIDVTEDPKLRMEMERLSGRRTVPQIFIDDNPIGGYDDVRELEVSGELDLLLSKPPGTT
ncbi:MAG: glutaredoxin 3 [Candidatus Binatia bacterium]